MRLIKAHVTNFRSVEDSGEFSIDPVTCLVGKNEAGKTAVLLALAALNPHPSTPVKLNKERDYPRRFLTEYSQRHKDEEALVVKSTWELEEPELNAVTEVFGPAALKTNTVTVSRRYNCAGPEWSLDVDLHKAFQHLFDTLGFTAQERKVLGEIKNTKSLVSTLENLGTPTEKHTALVAKLFPSLVSR
jgi:hypothetical protein